MKMTAFWDRPPRRIVKVEDVSKARTASIIRAMMETTRRYIPEGCHLQKITMDQVAHFYTVKFRSSEYDISLAMYKLAILLHLLHK
jgi:hypothetical protein